MNINGFWVGPFVALLLVIAAGAVVVWRKRRRIHEINERPPIQSKLLRPPGYSTQERLQRIDDHAINVVGALLGGIGASGGLGWPTLQLIMALCRAKPSIRQLAVVPESFMFVVVPVCFLGGVVLTIWSFRRLFWLVEKRRNHRLGMLGELATAEALRKPEIAASGYWVYHDVPGDGKWNVDHVVVGPGGVFVLETKSRSRRKATRRQEENVVFHDETTLHFPWGDDDRAIAQAAYGARWVRKMIKEFVPVADLRVEPIVIVPGWYTTGPNGEAPSRAMNENYFVNYLLRQPRISAPEQLQSVRAWLNERCRTVEF